MTVGTGSAPTPGPSRPDPAGDGSASTGGSGAPAAGDVLRFEVVGDVDLSTSLELRTLLEDAGRFPARAVVVDLSRITFIDCHGLGVLLSARTRMGARLLLQDPAPAVTRLLEMTGTQHHFDAPAAGTGTGADAPDKGPAPAGTTSPRDPTTPSGAATGSTPWPEEVVRATRVTVEHLQLDWPADLWVATRVEGDHQVVIAAAGPRADELPAGSVLPWPGVPGDEEGLACSTSPVATAAEPGAATGAEGPPTVASSGVLLLAGDEVVGSVCGHASDVTTAGSLAAADPVVRLLGEVLSVALTASRGQAVARDLAEVDVLTGLRNRRGWQGALTREGARCSRYGTSAGVVVIDLDGLKTTNDTYGHPAGDALLVATAEVLRRTCRPSDVLARPGGDEFAVLAVEADPTAVAALSSRISDDLRAAGIPASVAAASHEPGGSLEDTWARADSQMYVVKALRRTQGTTTTPSADEDAVATEVLRFYDREGLLPTSSSRPGEGEDRRTSSTASRLDFIHRARGAGLSPAQIRGALALRHSATLPSQQLQDVLQGRLSPGTATEPEQHPT